MREPLTRRDLLRGLAAGSLVAPAALLGTGCGDARQGNDTALGSVTYEDESALTPRRGGRIRVAAMASSSADTLDPARGGLSTDYVRHYMLYAGLTQYDSNLVPQLALAEDIATDDRRTWTIRLRKGVQFHDGKPLTSSDVVWSIMRNKDPATASKVKAIADQFESVVAEGPLTVRITLTGANTDLPAILAASHFLIVRDGISDHSAGIGAGPFRLKEFKPGVHTIVVRNPNYYRSDRAWLDEIELLGIPDEMSRVNALLAGDVHMVQAVNPRSSRRVRSSPQHKILVTKSSLFTDLVVRLDRGPTASEDFALGMKYLMDRETMVRAIFRGYATLANDHPIPPNHRYYRPGIAQRSYDPERARFHFRKAGALGLRLPVYASSAAEGSVEMATMLQQAGAQVGVNFSVNRVPADAYWSNHWMKHPLTFGNCNPRPTADFIFSLFFKGDAPWNESAWQNPRFDELLIAARGEASESLRHEMYGEMQQLTHDHCGAAVPAFIDLLDGFDRRIRGFRPLPLGGFMGYQFAEHVWFDG